MTPIKALCNLFTVPVKQLNFSLTEIYFISCSDQKLKFSIRVTTYVTTGVSDSYVVLQELFGSEGVEMVLHFLRKGSDRFYSGLGHNKLILSTVDCVWSVQLKLSSLWKSLSKLLFIIWKHPINWYILHKPHPKSTCQFQRHIDVLMWFQKSDFNMSWLHSGI